MLGACLGLVAVTGCKSGDDDDGPDAPVLGNGTIGTIAPAAHDEAAFTAPLDATPSPDGTEVYFTARNADGAGVFKAAASGGGITPLHVGDPFAGPVNITVSTDNQMLFVADPGATVGEADEGAIWMVPTLGGTPTVLAGTAGHSPRGITVVNENGGDQIYFTGNTPGEEKFPAVFRISASGGTPEILFKGEPLSDPNGIAVTKQGSVYVVDNAAGDISAGSARVIAVVDGGADIVAEGLKVGFPAGIALSQDETVALISAIDPEKRTDLVVRLNLATKEQTNFSSGIDSFEEAAGLHRAANAEAYAWCDSRADGSGTVYVLTP
jgi:DNA-binding beta-propeller fold protein YncE